MKDVKKDMLRGAWDVAERDAQELLPTLLDTDLTVSRYAERFHVSKSMAEYRLSQLVLRGELVMLMCRRSSENGGHVRAYRKP